MDDHRATEAEAHPRDMERRGRGGMLLLAIVLLFAVMVGVYYLFTMAPATHHGRHAGEIANGASHSADGSGDEAGSAR